MTNTELLKAAKDTIQDYHKNIYKLTENEVQSYREKFAELKRAVGLVAVEYESKKNHKEVERAILSAELFFKYKGEKSEKGLTDVAIKHQISLDTHQLKVEELQLDLLWKKQKEIYNSLGDLQNCIASRLKVEK